MTLKISTICLCALALCTAAAFAEGEGKPHPDIDMEGGMARWMEARTPAEQHAYLGRYFAGDWETKTSMWMGGPDAEPTVTEGSAHSQWILGGRYLRMESHYSMMDQPVEGFGFMGYDKMRKRYSMFWIDNMSTSMSFASGNFDPSGKNLIMFGSMDEPMTGEIGKNVKFVTRILDEDRHIFEIHDMAFGEEGSKVVEITYTRKK